MNLLTKVIGAGLSLGAVTLGPKIAEVAWRAVAKNEPPKDIEDMDSPLPAVIGFAALSAVVVAALQVMSKRSAGKVAAKVQGSRMLDREV